jgi:hypothetical protein
MSMATSPPDMARSIRVDITGFAAEGQYIRVESRLVDEVLEEKVGTVHMV